MVTELPSSTKLNGNVGLHEAKLGQILVEWFGV